MHLSEEQVLRFTRLYEALLTFVNDELHVVDDLFDHETMLMDPEEELDVADALWANRTMIDEFVSKNPYKLNKGDLAAIKGWKMAIYDDFVILDHTAAYSVFTTDEFAFGVRGISQGIASLFPQVPVMVKAALIPFDGAIIYARTMNAMNLVFGSGMLDMFDDWYESALRKHSLITTVPEFIEAYDRHRKIGEEKAVKKLVKDLEKESQLGHADGRPMAGMHVGILSSLDEEQREKAIAKRMDGFVEEMQGVVVDTLLSLAIEGEPCFGLHELLDLQTKASLQEQASMLSIKYASKMRKAELIAAFVEVLTKTDELLNLHLELCALNEYKAFRRLIESGGSASVEIEKKFEPGGSLQPYEPFTYLFVHDEVFTFLIPDEIFALCGGLDFDAIEATRHMRTTIERYASVYAELCGIVNTEDLYQVYSEHFPQGPSYADFVSELFSLHRLEEGDFGFWDSGEDLYVIDFHIEEDLDHYRYDRLEKDEMTLREYESHLDDLAEQHRSIPMRVIDKEEILELDAFKNAISNPQTTAFRGFLNKHVPDGEDDLFFADMIIENLYDMMLLEYPPSNQLEYLQGEGLRFDIATTNEMLGLLMNMQNSIPCWANNGWSPMELREKETGKKLFYNPDGSVMAVGRNDPCPCGSGKKYKMCCGKG